MEKREFINKYEINEDSFFYNYIDSLMQFLEDNRVNKWQKRKDYKKVIYKITEIKEKYPKIRQYIEKDEVVKLSQEELEVLKEYFSLIEEIQDIELVETFKLGLKEGKAL